MSGNVLFSSSLGEYLGDLLLPGLVALPMSGFVKGFGRSENTAVTGRESASGISHMVPSNTQPSFKLHMHFLIVVWAM